MSNHFTKASAIPLSKIPLEELDLASNKCNEDHRSVLEPHGPWQGNPYPVYPFSPYYAHPPPAYGPYGYYPPHSMAMPPAPTLLLPTPTLPTPTPPPHAQSASTFSSPGTTMSHSVSLSEFCMKYHLSAQTQEKLEKLDYTPGNKVIESLSEADWKESGLSVLASHSFLLAHRKFCEDICSGNRE